MMELELQKAFQSKSFDQNIQKMIDEMKLYERICVEVCLVALIASFTVIRLIEDSIIYVIYGGIFIIFVIFFGAACGFATKKKKYMKEKDDYMNYIKEQAKNEAKEKEETKEEIIDEEVK